MEIEQYLWGMTPEGEAVLLYVMRAASGAEVRLCNYGAAVVSVTMPDREGNLARVVAGYDRYDDYAGDLSCCGKTLGRWAGRIARGRMVLDGSEYRLERNDRASHLHGGSRGFGERLWEGRVETNRVAMSLLSVDGDQGYPGELVTEVVFDFDDDHTLEITCMARTDRTTAVDLASRLCIDLTGCGRALDQELRLASAHRVETDDLLLPTGTLLPLGEDRCGFGSFRPLRETLGPEAGADERSFRLDDWRPGILAEAGELRDPRSGRCLTLLTSQPCVTLRTGLHYADPSWNDDTAVALECGALPDAVNQPDFPSSVLHAGELYCQKTVLRFGLS